jgi:hypothetical protein
MKRSHRLWRACLLSSIALLVFTHTTPAQTPNNIIKKAVKAMSNGKGEKAFRAIRSWQVKGTVRRLSDKTTGSYQAMAQWPNLYTGSYDLSGFEIAVGFNGKSSWLRDSREGLRTLTGQASRDFASEAAYRNTRWFDYKKEKARLTLAGQTDISGKPANTVVLTTAKGVKIKLHFDDASGLLVREEFPAGAGLRVFDYSDHRVVNGVLEPHTILATEDQERYEIKLDEINHNVALSKAGFDFPVLSNEPLPDIDALLKAVKANEDRVDDLLEKYTYTETITKREVDPQGQLQEKEAETFELTFYKGNRIRRLINKNGKPLTPNEEANEQKRVEKRVREIEKRETENEKKAAKEREVAQETSGSPDGERGQRISIADVLRASKLVNPRRERFRGREVIVFDFEPLPGYKPQKNYEKFFGKTAGAIWVDVTDKQVARVEARLVEAYKVAGGLLASLREGATFVLEANRVNDEIWLPTRADINLAIKVFLIKGINVTQTIAYGNYKRFNVDAEKEKLKDPVTSADKVKP